MTDTVRPGPRNAITDVPGLTVGNAADASIRSGVTVLVPDQAAIAAVDSRGGAPGTRETDALGAGTLAGKADAIVLSGGSAFGLAAATAVQMRLAAAGRGFPAGGYSVPIVPAAILFDLANGGDKGWIEADAGNPYEALAQAAFDSRGLDVDPGRIGAGYGAKAGTRPGGLGTASAVDPVTGASIGALVAVNSIGEVTDTKGRFWAAPLEQDKEFGGLGAPEAAGSLDPPLGKLSGGARPSPRENTTVAIVATDAVMGHEDVMRFAVMAQDGLARAIRPAHTPFDGDTVFALSTGQTGSEAAIDPLVLTRLGAIAADCLARAIARGVHASREG